MKTPDVSKSILRLVNIMQRLRSPEGCPWDAAQTPETLKPYIIEETYEVLEAIEKGDSEAVCEELGDLLLQVVFQAQIFSERGEFDLGNVAESISDKLVRRHPHVFADSTTSDMEELNSQWNRIKNEEKRKRGVKITALGGIPRALPSLMRARKLTEKYHRSDGGEILSPSQALEEEVERIKTFNENLTKETNEVIRSRFGVLLLALVEIGHALNIDPEEALHQTVTKIISGIEEGTAHPDATNHSLANIAPTLCNTTTEIHRATLAEKG